MRYKDLEVIDLNEEENEASAEVEVEKKEESKEEKPENKAKEILSWVITLGITMLCVFLLKNYVIINANVPTGSMENTIMPDDNLLGYRLAYMNEEPQRGDVIFFYFPDDETQKFVKRVIGLPGETVRIENGEIYINDSEVPLEEPYLKEEWTRGTGPFVFEVPEGSYFVLGDNRNTSRDARYWANTYVAKEKIIGKAILIYFPFNHIGFIE